MPSSIIHLENLDENASPDNIYILEAINKDDAYYLERTNRNIGWITQEEQTFLRSVTIGIAGCGGMGGLVAQILLRAGVGRLKIADTEVFDASNINRQFGAQRGTIGKNKAITTARMLRATTDDTEIHVYPKGITEEYVDAFIEGCDIILDEIEYWSLAGRILLHIKARNKGIHIINANTVGFGTRLFLFTPTSATIEDCFQVNYDEANAFEKKQADKTATVKERLRVMSAVTHGLIPEFVNYADSSQPCGHLKAVTERVLKESKAPIFGTNPPMASGFLADHTILHLLRHSSVKRNVIALPPAPGYLFFDAAKMKAHVRQPSKIRHWMHKKKVNLFANVVTKKVEASMQKQKETPHA